MGQPLLFCLWGKTKLGKSTFASKFPNSFIVDFIPAALGVQRVVVSDRTEGEAAHAVQKVLGDDMFQRYRFVRNWDEFLDAVNYARTMRKNMNGPAWFIIDDSARWRAAALVSYLNGNNMSGKIKKWPIQAEWGQITQMLQASINDIQDNGFNVLVINRMKRSEESEDSFVPLLYPNGIDYAADVSVEMEEARSEDGTRFLRMIIYGNRFQYIFDEGYVEYIDIEKGGIEPVDFMKKISVPEEYYTV